MANQVVIWEPQPRQAAFITCPADDVGFGGARGGGKSDGVIGDWVNHEEQYGKDAIGLAFRRERTQLVELIERARTVLSPLGYKWHEQDKYFRGPKGGRLRFSYLESDGDADAYQGHSYTRLYPEEMGTFPNERPILKLQATLRSGAGVPCQMKGTCNPGGPGHQWVKARYKLYGTPRDVIRQDFVFENPFNHKKIPKTRVFIPSHVRDNRFLGDDYVANLFQVGSANLVKAWVDGDWDAVEGAFFDCWDEKRHVIEPFSIPPHWLRFVSMDWGFAAPFSIGWWAVASEPHALPARKADGRMAQTVPRGAIVRYREWYGTGGARLTAEQIAKGILEREAKAGERRDIQNVGGSFDKPVISYSVLDPSAFDVSRGPSIAEQLARSGVIFRRADNRRIRLGGSISGWDQMRGRLVGDSEGWPMMFSFNTCTESIRTIPVLQHDPDRPEDLDCWVAGTMVCTKDGDKPIETIRAGDIVDTPIGWREVLLSYVSGSGATVWANLSNGRRLEGTPHHKIYVQGKGLVALEYLQCNDVLEQRNSAWQKRSLSIEVWLTRAMRGAVTTIQAGRDWLRALNPFIDKSGWTPAMSSRLDFTSIISTGTKTTTTCPTWNASQPESTFTVTLTPENYNRIGWPLGGDLLAGKARLAQTHERCWKERLSADWRADIVEVLLRRSIRLGFIARFGAVVLRAASSWTKHASFAARNSGRDAARAKKCRPVRIVAVGRSEAENPVYNLTVADAKLFYANGILSSNTTAEDHAADEWRYACMSRPWARDLPKQEDPRMLGVGDQNTLTLNDAWSTQRMDDGRI